MADAILCKICGKRRARRPCPAVGGDICPICCGTHRESELLCPLPCEYLQEAHEHESPESVPEQDISNQDVLVTEEFVAEHEELLLFCVYSLLQASLRTPGTVDSDVMAALESLIQTQRTLQSGLVYEHVSPNAVAAGIQRSFAASLADYQRLREEREALSPVRDEEILKTLVFLHRVGQQNQNGKPRGRMYLDLLRHLTPETDDSEGQSRPGLII
jgi:hypothetical protein